MRLRMRKKEFICDGELEKIRTHKRLVKLYPRIAMRGAKRFNDMAAEHAKEERAKRARIIIKDLVNQQLHKKAQQAIAKKAQQKAQKIAARIM